MPSPSDNQSVTSSDSCVASDAQLPQWDRSDADGPRIRGSHPGERRRERWATDCTLLAARIRREGPGPYDDFDRGLYPPEPTTIRPEEAPIMAALARFADVDVNQVLDRAHETLIRFYEERGPIHPFDPGLIWAVESVMPYVPTTGLESTTYLPWSVAELWPALGAA